MKQTTIINIVVLGLLVALFASIHRLRASTRLRLWIVGWLFILAHFTILLWEPSLPSLVNLADAMAGSLILLCAISFLLSASVLEVGSRRLLVAVTLGVPSLLFCWLASFSIKAFALYLLLDLAGHGISLVLLWRFYRNRPSVVIAGTAVITLFSHWILYQIIMGQPEGGVYLILAELFSMHALLFWADHRRTSAGVLTTAAGLLAWAAVFPVALGIDAWWPKLAVNPEIWNIPKFFVAFGMIVTLLEEEILLAGREREQYQMLFERNPLPMWIFDLRTEQMLEVNAAAVEEYGYSRKTLLTMKVEDLLSKGGIKADRPNWLTLNGRRRNEGPWTLTKQDGTEALVETSAHEVYFRGIEAGMMLANDVTERVRLHDQLIHQANHDPLTGLPNRLLLEDRMKTALATAARHGTKTAIFCLDLDRFKQINDTMGHDGGDNCLREIAKRLKQRLRTVDTAARTGGEEFMVILDEIKSMADVERVAEDLLFATSAPHFIDGRRIGMSASFGIAVYPDDALEPADLWRMADTAMYRAKRAGGNRYCFFSRMVERSA